MIDSFISLFNDAYAWLLDDDVLDDIVTLKYNIPMKIEISLKRSIMTLHMIISIYSTVLNIINFSYELDNRQMVTIDLVVA